MDKDQKIKNSIDAQFSTTLAATRLIKPTAKLERSAYSAAAFTKLGDISKDAREGKGFICLFAGAQGKVATQAAEALANELGKNLLRIDLAAVVSKYLGETEKHLDSLFAAAERDGVVLLLDEADALFGKRSDIKDSHDRYANTEISYLLQRLETYGGLAIISTSKRHVDDAALRQHSRYIIDFPVPKSSNICR